MVLNEERYFFSIFRLGNILYSIDIEVYIYSIENRNLFNSIGLDTLKNKFFCVA
jgi:hypothetical protein